MELRIHVLVHAVEQHHAIALKDMVALVLPNLVQNVLECLLGQVHAMQEDIGAIGIHAKLAIKHVQVTRAAEFHGQDGWILHHVVVVAM